VAKLTGKKKAAFLERMAKGRKKAARGNPKKKARKAAKGTKSKRAPKKKAAKNSKLTGAKKAAFLARMAKCRKKAARGNPKKKAKRNTRREHRNSDGGMEAAERKFEEFHGKPPSSTIEYERFMHYRENFAEMGKLKELRVYLDDLNPDFPLTRFGATQAVCTPDGRNIYFTGGDQSIDYEALDIASDKDMIELGPCTRIVYHTVKGFHDFEPTNYWHDFGEEDGIMPVLAYDRLNKQLFLLGGNYTVRPEGIVN